MKHRRFGQLGWSVSEIGFGSWALGSNWGPQNDDDSVAAIHRALDLGCNFIDTARAYDDGRSERIIARALKGRPRGSVYVATEVPPVLPGDWPPSPYDTIEQRFPEAHIRAEVDKSLRDLETDCLDLVQIHTWSRGWNRDPSAFQVLRALRKEGKVRGIGVSTPEHDQNAVIDLIRGGWVDTVQLIYNIFSQEAQEGLLDEAAAHGAGVIVRVAFDESSLTGKLTDSTRFPEGDIRGNYFAGDRLVRTVRRVKAIEAAIAGEEPDTATAALKFALKPAAVSTVIAGIRNPWQAEKNCAVGAMAPLTGRLEQELRKHYWRRALWHSGK
ncbi:MAG: aldo/keto reductase [Acidobacteria bacterium]|nr:aldo/keto reductase [Acidobacteriota bacterium]